jgi:hypothetical protein
LDKHDQQILDLLLDDAEPTRLLAEALRGEHGLLEALDRLKQDGLLFSFEWPVSDWRGSWDDTWWGLTPAGFDAMNEVPGPRYWLRSGVDPEEM